MLTVGFLLETPPAMLLVCYLHYKTLRNARNNGFCLLYTILFLMPIVNASFSCVGQYAMIILRCIDIQQRDPSVTKHWNLSTYIRVFWTTQTSTERKNDLKVASNQSDSVSDLVINSHVDLDTTTTVYWISLTLSTIWQFLAFILIPNYFYRHKIDPIPYELLDFSNLQLVFEYGLYLLLIYSSIVLSRSVYGHAVAYVFKIPYKRAMIQPWAATSLAEFWGSRWLV
jgi:hypothetical protein